MAVTWAASADKHRIPHEDAIHAIANAHYVEIEFDEPRLESKVRPTLYIGPPRQLGGHLLEVMVELIPPVACTSSTSCRPVKSTSTEWERTHDDEGEGLPGRRRLG